MLHPGLIPILDLNSAAQTPLTEVVSVYLEADLSHFIIQADESVLADTLLQDLFALREQMDFHVILPAHCPSRWKTLSLGVHTAIHADAIATARSALGEKQVIVCFANSFDGAALAEKSGADAVILGSVFGENGIGVSELEDVCQTLSVPIFASGGIDAGNLLQIKDAGAYGFCVPELDPGDGSFEHEVAKLAALWGDFSNS